MTEQAIVIENLAAFRRALREAEGGAARDLTAALKRVGERVLVPAIRSKMPHLTGELEKGVRVSARGTSASILNKAPHGAGSEWGSKGKWETWVERYGVPPRFVWPTIEQKRDEVVDEIAQGLEDLITIRGWAH